MSVLTSLHPMPARRRSLLATTSKFLLGTVMLLGAATSGQAASESFLATFPGPSGTISLPAVATGKSNAGGSGNLISQFTTTAGADGYGLPDARRGGSPT